MGKSLTLILGGARSGKSSYAQKLMEESGKPVLFVATATAGDDGNGCPHTGTPPEPASALDNIGGTAQRRRGHLQSRFSRECIAGLLDSAGQQRADDLPGTAGTRLPTGARWNRRWRT